MSDPSKSNMGDVFRQRRAAAAAASASTSSNNASRLTPITSSSSSIPTSGFGSNNAAASQGTASSGRKSFAEIQREQELLSKQQQQQQQSSQGQQRYSSNTTAHINQYQQRGVQQQQQQPRTDEYGRLVRPSGSGSGSSSLRGNNASTRGGEYTRDNNSRGGNDRYNNNSNTSSSNARGRGGDRSTRHNNTSDFKSSLPTEQGIIHTLLDKFGFIQCADRPNELFFHYSEYVSGHSDTLNIGDEVEFKIGMAESRRGGGGGSGSGGGGGKMSAYNVTLLPKGTIYWEKEDEPIGVRRKGVVESVAVKGVRGNNRNSIASVDGMIYLVNDEEEADGKEGISGGEDDDKKKEMEIHWTFSDYSTKNNNNSTSSGSNGLKSSSSSMPRLDRKDIVEFTLVTERRTGKKYARNITLLQSERERQRIEYETKLLQNATLERGKVVSNKGDFGFLKSVNRKEEIYFHVSHIIVPEDNNDNDASSLLKEGQDVEFYVVNECSSSTSSGGGRGNKKGIKSLSARKIKLLPWGSVKFEHVIAQGVTGIVIDCPVQSVMEPFGGNSRSGGIYVERKKEGMGKIRLQQEVIAKVNDDDGEEQVITEVVLHPDMYPGGTFAISRTGSEVGCWIRPGDVLLFDVVRKVIDGVCHAMPTKFLRPGDGSSRSVVDDEASSSVKPSIHLIETSLCGRAQGMVRSIHDNNYGFIQLAERNVDAYFPLFEVFPSEIQSDLLQNNPLNKDEGSLIQKKGGRTQIEVGMEVEFDLSLQMLTNAGGGRSGGGGGRYKQNSRSYEKESLRGRRVQILPKGSVMDKVEIAYGVKASVTRVDTKQPFVGTIELEESIEVEIYNKRHPLVTRLLDDILAGRYGSEEVIFHDVLSEKDAQVVISMVNAKDDLHWSYVPENADGHSRKLCITVKRQSSESVEQKEEGGSDPNEKPAVETSTTTITTTEDANEASDKKEDAVSGGKKKEGSEGKKGKKTNRAIKSLRFDKLSFPDMTIGPLGVGDIVTCDIFQSRKSGAFLVENIAVIERKEKPVVVVSDNEDGNKQNQTRKSLSGFVSEVVPSRQFGFITAVNNEGVRTGEHVFFHFKEVQSSSGEDAAQGGKKFTTRKDPVTKGDEVKFDAGTGKNGKLSATSITILPRGTLKMPTKANNASSSCTGYILIEPSHTTLANTPAHVVTQSGPAAAGAGGRWANVRDEKSNGKSGSTIQEGGVILVLSDPSNLFSSKPSASSPIKKTNSTEGEAAQVADEAKTTDEEAPAPAAAESDVDKSKTKEVEQSTQSAVGTHIRYKLSSMASRGYSNGRSDGPKRGDLVSFGKTKGVNLVKDIRVEKAAAATSLRGTLTDINIDNDTAVFVSLTENDETKKYEINLTEVVSCDKKMLKDQEQVDGVLHEGKIYGVCRTKDIYIASSFGRDSSGSSGGLKERPRLNLTVKKALGGQVQAQSKMAKGPDGTDGFADGWTTRTSPHDVKEERSLSIAAAEFVPTLLIATSGFESTDGDEGNTNND